MRSVVIGNREENFLGFLSSVLNDLGASVFTYLREEDRLPHSLETVDLIVHLGSSWSLTEPSIVESCTSEIEFIRHSAVRGVPMVGICFGAQLLSLAFGGDVSRNDHPEIGWTTVNGVTGHELLDGKWMQWHYDGFTCPQNGEVVATNSNGVQSIRVSRSLGIQFHPEANSEVVEGWILAGGDHELAGLEIDPNELLSMTASESTHSAARCRALISGHLDGVL